MMTCGGMEDMYDQEVMNEKTVSSRGMGDVLIYSACHSSGSCPAERLSRETPANVCRE